MSIPPFPEHCAFLWRPGCYTSLGALSRPIRTLVDESRAVSFVADTAGGFLRMAHLSGGCGGCCAVKSDSSLPVLTAVHALQKFGSEADLEPPPVVDQCGMKATSWRHVR